LAIAARTSRRRIHAREIRTESTSSAAQRSAPIQRASCVVAPVSASPVFQIRVVAAPNASSDD